MQRGKFVVFLLPCYKHVRCDIVISSAVTLTVLLPLERFFYFYWRFIQKNSFNPAHLLMVSYPLKWQSTPRCQLLRPNPLECLRLRIRALWTQAPTIFQCCNVVQVPSKSKMLPDAGVLRALTPQPHWMKCSVLGPWFTRQACDRMHSCINLWPRCTPRQKPMSACTFPRFPLYCLPAEAVPLVSSHYGKKDRLRCWEGWNCRQSRREMLFIGWWPCESFVEKNTALKSRSKWFGVDRNTAGDSCSLYRQTKLLCMYSNTSNCNRLYTFRGETSVLDQFLCPGRMLGASCCRLYLLTAFNARENILCLKSSLLWQQRNKKVA